MFNEEKLIEKIGDEPKCYLTGRSICLSDSRSYHLDHVIPRSKGGDNSIENCEIACREANQAKSNMSYDNFIQLCREIVANHDLKQ
jgi:5-methylcytosine-specific restriction endonuclease McrA